MLIDKINIVNKNLKANYDDYYKECSGEWRRLGAIDKASNIVNLCKTLQINSVLEVGAGDGAVLQRLAGLRFAKEFSGLEISSSGLNSIILKKIPQLKECTLFDGYNIPFKNKKFDLVILSHVIEHVEYTRKLLYEAKRVARYVFVEVPVEDTFRLPIDFKFDKVGHINFYSPKTIRRLIQSCNLEVIKQTVTNPSKDVYFFLNGKKGLLNFFCKKYLLRLNPNLATSLFTYHSSMICKDTSQE